MSDARVEQYFRFVLGILVLGPLAIAFLADQLNGRTFTVDPFYSTIVGAVIAYFFTSGAAAQANANMASTIKSQVDAATAAAALPAPVVTSGPSSNGQGGSAPNG